MPLSEAFLSRQDLAYADPTTLTDSALRFPDGGQYRIEIPTVEGPDCLEAVLHEARTRSVPIHRVSQGSGIMLTTDEELRRLVELQQISGTEVLLFVGPRAAYDVGVQASSSAGRLVGGSLRGSTQLSYAVEDVLHAASFGIGGVLVSDLGLLAVLGKMKRLGDLPQEFVLKSSVFLPAANAACARVLEDLGADSLNMPVDLSLPILASIRNAVAVPLDVYVESTDDFGGVVRHYEVPELVRVLSPIHLKFSVRNAQGVYPSGQHLAALTIASGRERVRRAEIGLSILRRYSPSAVTVLPVPRSALSPGSVGR